MRGTDHFTGYAITSAKMQAVTHSRRQPSSRLRPNERTPLPGLRPYLRPEPGYRRLSLYHRVVIVNSAVPVAATALLALTPVAVSYPLAAGEATVLGVGMLVIVVRELELLLDARPDLEVVAEADNGADAVECCLDCDIDLATLDVAMPRLTGLQAVRELARRRPDLRTSILSMYDREEYFFQAIGAERPAAS